MRVRWSQNFLVNRSIAEKAVEALQIKKEDQVLEIGPGQGILTQRLIERAKDVVAVEIDPRLSEGLMRRLGSRQNFKLINSDFLDENIRKDRIFPNGDFKVIGNLPYAVVSPILQKILSWKGWERAIFMVQKEVGERILSNKGSKSYGLLTLSVRSRARAEKVGFVSRSAFRPRPQVESMLLKVTPLSKPYFGSASEEEIFFKVAKAAFAHRRKTILNSISYSIDLSIEKIKDILEACHVPSGLRAEQLSLEDFKRLAQGFPANEKNES